MIDIKRCREIVDKIFVALEGPALDEYFILDAGAVSKAKEACAKIIKASVEAGECQC